jgi:uncharacterized protein
MTKLNVLALGEDPGVLSLTAGERDLEMDPEIRLDGPARLDGTVYRVGQKVVLRGRVQAQLRLTCARCLKEFVLAVETPLELIGLPGPLAAREKEPAQDPDEEVELAVVAYHGEQLDLAPEMRSVLTLAVPMKPLCREDCTGLCPHCGRPQAEGPCRCGPAPAQGPFSVLQQIQPKRPSDGEQA